MHSGMMMGVGGGWSSQGVPHCLGGPSDIEYSLDTKKISKGMDKRTTVMIRNIPNKYTQVILLINYNTLL
jgi:RNA recognition motif 2